MGRLVQQLIDEGRVTAVHDVSDGGLLVAVTEMALASGIGAVVTVGENWHPYPPSSLTQKMFGEDQARYVVSVADTEDMEEIINSLHHFGNHCRMIGWTEGDTIEVRDTLRKIDFASIPLSDLRAAHEGFFPKLMGADAALA